MISSITQDSTIKSISKPTNTSPEICYLDKVKSIQTASTKVGVGGVSKLITSFLIFSWKYLTSQELEDVGLFFH